MARQLRRVRIAADDPADTAAIYGLITGTTAIPDATGVTVPIENAELRISATGPTRGRGVFGIDVTVDDLAGRVAALSDMGVTTEEFDDHVHVTLAGLDVSLSEEPPATAISSTAHLDHVAIAVHDVVDDVAPWEAATGVAAHQMGLHPISNGAFSAARIELEDRMLELLSPTPGVDSPMAARVAANGPGPMALAMPVSDVDACKAELEGRGVRVLWNDPHWMVHPADAGGVLVQLTPRVQH